MRRLLTTTALVALAPLAATAQEVIALDPITVTANLEPAALSETGASVNIVTADDLALTGETRLAETLSHLPGVTLTANGPLGTRTGIQIRGASQNYVGVYVDGIEVTDPSVTQVSLDFGTLLSGDVSRVEVLKGSQSALYGSEAVGGVIDITTRRATGLGTEQQVALEYGSYETVKGSYGFASKSEDGEVAFTLSHVQSDGFSAADENDGNTEKDGFRANRLSFYGHRDLQNGLRLGVSGFYEENEGDYDEFGGVGGDGTPGDDYNDNETWALRGFAEFTAGGIDHQIDLTYFDAHRVSTFNGFPGIYDGTRTKLAYQGGTDLGATGRLSFGADWTRETAQSSFGFDEDDSVAGLFAEYSFAPVDTVDLTATLRHEDHSSFGGQTTARLAGVWRPVQDLAVRASVGSGYRAPSLFELYSGFGDPTLTPETSLSADLGVEKTYGDRARVSATLFYLEVDDLIDYDFIAVGCLFGPGCYAQVPGTSRRSGLELAGEVALSDSFALAGSYTYTDSTTNASSSWAQVARHMVNLIATADIAETWTGALTLQHAADRAPGLDDYTVVHATLSHDFGSGHEGYIRIENLFDEEYQLVNGYGTSDRAIYVGLRKSF